ncbi:hypothetical protein ACQUWZ_26805, partial [Ralstonia pseudosolanacearum]|uniref:hypothetical protein n=1 Tax=Ralstonia pseudosolanacearum TaxID=1310165 RepID=UPI003D167A9C
MDNSNYQDGGQVMTDEELNQQLNSLSDDAVLSVYMESLLIEKGLADLDDETREKMISEMKERAVDLINYSIIDALPEGKAEELSSKIEQGEDGEALMNAAIEEAGIDAGK